MEPLLLIVGFLGAGKTRLLRRTTREALALRFDPFIILNDYENAQFDAQTFLEFLEPGAIRAFSGNCICCSGLGELRRQVGEIPPREHAVTLIEANGTTDAVALLEFLGVGLPKRFLPPVQIAIVDARLWQQRGTDNQLEYNQVQASSLIVLNRVEDITATQRQHVTQALHTCNPYAQITLENDFRVKDLLHLSPPTHNPARMSHKRSHAASCSVDLPATLGSTQLKKILDALPKGILRVKGCTRLDNDTYNTFFERTPNGEVAMRRFNAQLVAGPKLLTVGPGSDPAVIAQLVARYVS